MSGSLIFSNGERIGHPRFIPNDERFQYALSAEILTGSWSAAAVISQVDTIVPGPADAVGLVVGIVGTIVAGGVLIYELVNEPVKTTPAVVEYRLPSWKKVTVDMNHIIDNHTVGGSGGPQKDKFPPGMTEAAILKAIQEAYKHAEKLGSVTISWQDGVEQARQFFQGPWRAGVIQFYFNYTTNTIESAWPK